MPDDAVAPAANALPRWERIALILLLGLFVAVGLNNLSNGAFIGQDFQVHLAATNHLITHPNEWFTFSNTSRPLIYWLAIDGQRITQNKAPFEFASLIFILLNAGALWLMHDLARRVIRSPALRIAVIAFIAFLPVTLIATVVFAGDAVATPPFVLLCWCLVRWIEAPSPRDAMGYAVLGGVVLCVGHFAKFTFVLLPFAALLLLFLFWRWQRLPPRRAWPFLVFIVLVPTAVAGWLWQKSTHALASEPERHSFVWRGTGEMTWKSLLGLKRSDLRIFDAPGYWDGDSDDRRTTLPLLVSNDYSYPALLHLGIFTDVSDFALNGALDNGTPRPEPQKIFSRWSVRTGVLFSILAIVAVALFLWRLLQSVGRSLLAPSAVSAIGGVMAFAWFVPLVLVLPFTRHAYDWGYWLPRLITPALWFFGLELYVFLDRAIGTRTRVVGLVALVTALQAFLHVRSVWY